MQESDSEIDALIAQFLACADTNRDAIPDNHFSFSHQTSSGQQYRPYGPKPTFDPVAFSPIPDDEVIALFRLKASRFLELHRQHTSPVDYSDRPFLRSHLQGACRHLRDNLRRVLVTHVPLAEAHVNSNLQHERLCLACIRSRRDMERYQCTTCGGRNPVRGRYKRFSRSAVEITEVSYSPLTWHVPMCCRCRHVISRAYPSPSAPQPQEVSA